MDDLCILPQEVFVYAVGKGLLFHGFLFPDSSGVYLCIVHIFVDDRDCSKTRNWFYSLQHHTLNNAGLQLVCLLQHLNPVAWIMPSEICLCSFICFILDLKSYNCMHVKVKVKNNIDRQTTWCCFKIEINKYCVINNRNLNFKLFFTYLASRSFVGRYF